MLDHRKKGKCRALKADFYFGGMFLCSIKMINGWQNNTEVKIWLRFCQPAWVVQPRYAEGWAKILQNAFIDQRNTKKDGPHVLINRY